jgi:hypothetical protein
VPYVYAFDHKHRRPPMEMKDLLGGKGANLAEMTSVLELPVPSGFTISTDACRAYMYGGWPDGHVPEDDLHTLLEVRTDEGLPLLERMNGTKFVTESKDDLPFVFFLNGRRDGSIPWENNPPFYRALSESGQGFAARLNCYCQVAACCPRVLADVSGVDTSTQLLGQDLAHPILVAPTTAHRQYHPEGEAATRRGARPAARTGRLRASRVRSDAARRPGTSR